jgi:hypothetical protein
VRSPLTVVSPDRAGKSFCNAGSLEKSRCTSVHLSCILLLKIHYIAPKITAWRFHQLCEFSVGVVASDCRNINGNPSNAQEQSFTSVTNLLGGALLLLRLDSGSDTDKIRGDN